MVALCVNRYTSIHIYQAHIFYNEKKESWEFLEVLELKVSVGPRRNCNIAIAERSNVSYVCQNTSRYLLAYFSSEEMLHNVYLEKTIWFHSHVWATIFKFLTSDYF